MKKFGLTGNIASGKSEVEKIIQDFGFIVYDLDKVTHNLYQEKKVQKELMEIFKTINRKKISDIVFKNKDKLKTLENIIHPKLKDFINNLKEDNVFISGALIFEAGFENLFNKIIFVDCDEKIRLQRLMKRNNLKKEEAILRIKSQNSKFKNSADFIIINNSSIDELKQKTKEIIEKITKE